MAVSNTSTVVGFDADAALAAAQEVAGDALHMAIEYDAVDFNSLYVDEGTVALYGDTERMVAHFEKVHSYVHIDFTEQQMFEDVLYAAGGVRAFTAHMEHVTAVRMLVGQEGLFLALDPDAPVTPVLEAVEDAIDGE
jgi:hypothetical protein